MVLIVLFAALALCITSTRAPAQDDSVTISAAEFQRLVYSVHLLTQLEEKPELAAGPGRFYRALLPAP